VQDLVLGEDGTGRDKEGKGGKTNSSDCGHAAHLQTSSQGDAS